MSTSVRLATMADYQGICEVMDEGDAHHRDALPHIFKKPEGPVRSIERIGEMIEREDTALFLALLEGEVVGVLVIMERAWPEVPLYRPGRYALIDNVAVKASARRAGVGLALMTRAHAWTQRRGLTRVQLGVWAFNEGAIAFYEGLGYKAARLVMDIDLNPH